MYSMYMCTAHVYIMSIVQRPSTCRIQILYVYTLYMFTYCYNAYSLYPHIKKRFLYMYVISQDFYEKYQFLIGVKSSDLSSQIDLFLKGMDFTPEHYQVGSTKVIRALRTSIHVHVHVYTYICSICTHVHVCMYIHL